MNYRAKSPMLRFRAAFATTPAGLEDVLAENLRLIEHLAPQARARIAAHDAVRAPAPLPSFTSAFVRRRAIFGPVTVGVGHD